MQDNEGIAKIYADTNQLVKCKFKESKLLAGIGNVIGAKCTFTIWHVDKL